MEVFGLEERYRSDNGVVYLRLPDSTQHLALGHESNAAMRVNRFGFTRAGSVDTDALVRRVLSHGGSLVRCRHLGKGVVEVVVADPDGNVVSL